MKFEKICRTCLIEKECLQTIFHLVDMLKECASIQVDMDDGLPELICLDCVGRLNNSFEFRKQCRASDETLREYSLKATPLVSIPNGRIHKNDFDEDCDEKDFDIKSENSFDENDSELPETTVTITKDTDSEDDNEPLINKIIRANQNKSNVENILQDESENRNNDKEPLSERNTKVQAYPKDKTDNKSVLQKQRGRTKSFKKLLKGRKDKAKLKNGIPCTKCSQCFELESDLEIHMISHPVSDEIICTKCSKSFSNLAYLRKHVTTHLTNKPYKCTYCSKSFANAGGRISHLRTHTGEKPFVCSTCGKRFSDSSGLSAHMKSHSDVKNFACTFCPKFFKFPNDLRNHVRIHTGEKPFLCTVCGESFAQAYCVTKHMRKHTGERPYACTECDRKFRLNHQLKFHMRTHTGEKPHVCKVCEMGFARPESLVRHNRSHTGEMPYICDICFKSYPASSSLARHKRTHGARLSQISDHTTAKSSMNLTEA